MACSRRWKRSRARTKIVLSPVSFWTTQEIANWKVNITSTTRFYNDIKLYKTYIPRLLWEHTPPCVCVRVCTCTIYLKLYTLLDVTEVEFHQLVHKLDQFLQRNRIQLFTTNNTIAYSCSLQTTQSRPAAHYKRPNISTFKGTTTVYWIAWENSTCPNCS